MQLYTRKGDDGTTGLLYGGRVRKDAPSVEANGAVDEAQAAIGLARAEVERGSEVDVLLVGAERDLWVLMAELATAPGNRHKLVAGTSLVTAEMVAGLETAVDGLGDRFELPAEFVIPGQDRVSALLDVARTVVRRAERLALGAAADDSQVVPYLNRLSTLLWVMARWQEHGHALPSRQARSAAGA
jgi:cob(I)alamin adenosyltransferase